jgi:3-dehydroquinate synthase
VDFHGYKNVIGAFYQPKKVIIDPDVLATLEKRQVAAGMAEAIKIFATFDADMFSFVEREGCGVDLDKVILRALELKKMVVEQDERESGLRRVLNFGHTVGHAIERLGGLLHGECVALGMLCMSAPAARERIAAVAASFGLPTAWQGSADALESAVLHDKKTAGDSVNAIIVDQIGEYREVKMTAKQIVDQSRKVLELI